MKVPFCKPDINERDIDNVVEVLRSGNLYYADVCKELEEGLERRYGRSVVLLKSCTDALMLAGMLLRRKDPSGQYMIVPDITFCSSAHAMRNAGFGVALADVSSNGLVDIASVKTLMKKLKREKKTVAGLVGVDLYGQMMEWDDVSRELGIPVIQDAAHSLGSRDWKARPIGHADYTCVSFYATKPVTCADGGVLFVSDDEKDIAMELANNGITSRASDRYTKAFEQYDVNAGGYKMLMNDYNAALLKDSLIDSDARCGMSAVKRIKNALVYEVLLEGIDGFKPVRYRKQCRNNTHLTVWRCADKDTRDNLIAHCQERGVQLSVHFKALSTTNAYHTSYRTKQKMNSHKFANQIVSLPNYPSMSDGEIRYVCEVVSGFFKGETVLECTDVKITFRNTEL